MSRGPALWLRCLIVLTLLPACSGKLIFLSVADRDPCEGVTCVLGKNCNQGECVLNTIGRGCSPLNPVGECKEDSACITGSCYSNQSLPPRCDIGINGYCDGNQSCVNGECTPITLENACSPTQVDGLCPGLQICARGYCFADDGQVRCSAENPVGICPTGQSCIAGQCQLFTGLCGPDDFNGTCATWEKCVQGTCIGPVAPDACSPEEPQGRCPAKQACIGGTCAMILQDSVCNEFNPTGLCEDGRACVEGRCVVIEESNLCSAQQPQGLCDGGDTCTLGVCTPRACGQGGFVCPNGLRCGLGECVAQECSPVQPGGVCTDSQAACEFGRCVTPSCSPSHPSGLCSAGLQCNDGACTLPPCSTSSPYGPCPDPINQVCNEGVCELGACSAARLGGFCSGNTCTFDPQFGCVRQVPATCCDESLRAATGGTTGGCTLGTCAPPACSANQPNGACPEGEFCISGTCQLGECGPFNLFGICPSGKQCIGGVCTRRGCASAGLPDVFCQQGGEDMVCDVVRDICTIPECSPAHPGGYCRDGQEVCCTAQLDTDDPRCPGVGQCYTPTCSSEFLGGFCPPPQVCVPPGVCQKPACSPQEPTGVCPISKTCNAGVCELKPCGNGTTETDNTSVQGSCPGVGEVCCNATFTSLGDTNCQNGGDIGQCFAPSCSLNFPYGNCPVGELCVDGTCLQPCSGTRRKGWCANGDVCVDGGCAAPCAGDQDCDFISDSDEGFTGNLATAVDTDGDGSPDAFDRDSDNDTVIDAIEAGDRNLGTPPRHSDSDGIPDFRDPDSDGDCIADQVEVGPAPSVPRDTDGDGFPDMIDSDSDNDKIPDRCEASDANSGPYLVCQNTCPNNTNLITNLSGVLNTDGDTLPDFRDIDSDNDGIPDTIEARPKSHVVPNPLLALNGVDTDGDGIPDYREVDSDNDGVLDSDEDVRPRPGVFADGIVNCQVDGFDQFVEDSRLDPFCGKTASPYSPEFPYDYNPGCIANGVKCLLRETSRTYADTDGNFINDGEDGIFKVCSAANLKSLNLFYSRPADYALALETEYAVSRKITLPSGKEVGLVFEDTNTARGSYAVRGFVLNRTPTDPNFATLSGTNASDTLIQKALAQSFADQTFLQNAANVDPNQVALVINRNTTSFDGYGVVVSRYNVRTTSSISTSELRNNIVRSLAQNAFSPLTLMDPGPSTNQFTVILQTVYRGDNGNPGSFQGVVMVVGAVVPTGSTSDTTNSYNYRTKCTSQTLGACPSRIGCRVDGGQCVEDANYQIPLFYADNITSGSALAQFGDDVDSVCQSMTQKNPLVDFLWTIDTSGSMNPWIAQVSSAAALFFPLLDNSEADYRVGSTTTSAATTYYPPVFPGCEGLTTQNECSTNASTGGCTWDPNNPKCAGKNETTCSVTPGCRWGGLPENPNTATGCTPIRCVERCTSFSESECSTNASLGCVWQSNMSNSVGTCRWDGCESINIEPNLSTRQTNCTNARCKWSATESKCYLHGTPDRVNGHLMGDFTGAIAGRTDDTLAQDDRSVAYSCSQGCVLDAECALRGSAGPCNANRACYWTGSACRGNCCPGCVSNPNNTTTLQSPSCYFAARLPDDDGSGNEYGLLMTEWALFRAGAYPHCRSQTNQLSCAASEGCIWLPQGAGGTCIQGYCSVQGKTPPNTSFASRLDPINMCDGFGAGVGARTYPVYSQNSNNLADRPSDDLMPANCEWDYNSSANNRTCLPNLAGYRCSSIKTQVLCNSQAPRCSWNGAGCVIANGDAGSEVLCSATNEDSCVQRGKGFCEWDTCNYIDQELCEAVSGCLWTGVCQPITNGGSCRPLKKRMFRANATKVAVLLSDEEECYVKDGPVDPANPTSNRYNSQCGGGSMNGRLMFYNDPIRLARTASYLEFMRSRNITVFALTGDKANKSLSPYANGAAITSLRGGCSANVVDAGGATNLQKSEPGQAYVDVAEGTGGGWGSICATDLFPSIEAVVISGLSQASNYKLNGLINGRAVQPIGATIKVAVEVCNQENEYPLCSGFGSQVIVASRSREDGFDYDPVTNSITFYGSARPKKNGSITVSYRYWNNREQPAFGDPDCPCPETSPAGCGCTPGWACGMGGSLCSTFASSGTCNAAQCTWTGSACIPQDKCDVLTSQNTCDAKPGCNWNSADGGKCYTNGACEPDPTCGGSCPANYICDPTRGLCVCDVSCGGGCAPGRTCDNNFSIYPCSNASTQNACQGISGCSWDSLLQQCTSNTCGQCICDPTCGGGCPAGSVCDSNLGSGTCGQCVCDTTCANQCTGIKVCNTDTNSSGCGLCRLPTCGNCPPGWTCNVALQICVCDQTCGGCPTGSTCDSNPQSDTCGQCQCDITCGGQPCGPGLICNTNLNSTSCGQCVVDSTCGGLCPFPTICNPITGLCESDDRCGGPCPVGFLCNEVRGRCEPFGG